MSPAAIDNGISIWSKRIALVLIGWFGSSAYHGTLLLHQEEKTLQHVRAVDIPKLKAAANCEALRGDRAAVLAGEAIVAATVDGTRVPSPKEIPRDNCPHPAAPPPVTD